MCNTSSGIDTATVAVVAAAETVRNVMPGWLRQRTTAYSCCAEQCALLRSHFMALNATPRTSFKQAARQRTLRLSLLILAGKN